MKGRLLASESHQNIDLNSEVDNSIISQSRSTPTILPSLPTALDHSSHEDKSDQGKKESASHFVERIRANSTSSQSGQNEQIAPSDSSPMKLEFRKSRSLVRKIQERTATKESGIRLDNPKDTDSLNPLDKPPSSSSRLPSTKDVVVTPRGSDPTVSSIPSSSNSLGNSPGAHSPLIAVAHKTSSKVQSSPHPKPVRQRQIPGLTLQNGSLTPSQVSTPSSNTSNINDGNQHLNFGPVENGTPVFQHYSFPKSVASATSGSASSSASVMSVQSASPIVLAHVYNSTMTNHSNSKSPLVTPMPPEYRIRTKMASDVHTHTEFIVVENSNFHSQTAGPKNEAERAVENDRILQQRLQQAKALNRKDDSNGAVMFKFALWGGKRQNIPGNAGGSINSSMAKAGSGNSSDVELAVAQPKSASKLRGPKIARENQLHSDDGTHEINESASHRSQQQSTYDAPHTSAVPHTPQRVLRSQSVPTTPATITLFPATAPVTSSTLQEGHSLTNDASTELNTESVEDSYSDDEFERLVEEDDKHQPLTLPTSPQAPPTSAAPSAATSATVAPVRNLAMALRTLVVEAKTLGSEYSSPAQSGSDPQRNPSQYLSPQPSVSYSNQEIPEDSVDNSYSSFNVVPSKAQLSTEQQTSLPSKSSERERGSSTEDDADTNSDWDDNEIEEEDQYVSNRSVSERQRSMRRSFSAEHLDDSATAPSIHTVMSKSGPATFLSSINAAPQQDLARASDDIVEEILVQDQSFSSNPGATRNQRAKSCGVNDLRTSLQGIAYEGGADPTHANTVSVEDPRKQTHTSLTSREDHKREHAEQQNSTVVAGAAPKANTPESFRYSSRPEPSSVSSSSTTSRYKAMRQTRQEALQQQQQQRAADSNAQSLPASVVNVLTPRTPSSNADEDMLHYSPSHSAPSHYSPDNNSVSLGHSDQFFPLSHQLHQPLQIEHSHHGIPGQTSNEEFDLMPSSMQASPRLTEMSEDEDEILGLRPAERRGTGVPAKLAATAAAAAMALDKTGAFTLNAAVTSLNPTGNPFHRFAQPTLAADAAGMYGQRGSNSMPHSALSGSPPISTYSQPNNVLGNESFAVGLQNSSLPGRSLPAGAATGVGGQEFTVAVVPLTPLDTTNLDAPEGVNGMIGNETAAATATSSPLKWIKGDMIGEGTFGKVYKGLNQSTGELLAIKQFYLADGSEEEVDELQREIAVMWELDHENIVRYLGTSKTDRFLYIILEYVTGGSIASMLAQYGSFTESLIRRFSCHILTGISYLHSQGIIHRDIKGANILVTDTGIAKLADFGCSKRLAGLCTTSLEESMHMMRGSVPWMSPEVIKQAGYGRSSDIWSFGATLIEMATGKPPWSEYTNNLATLFHVATSNTPPVTPSHLSPPCKELIESCLVCDPEQRATAVQLLQSSSFLQEEMQRRRLQQQQLLMQQQQQQLLQIPSTPLYRTSSRQRRGNNERVMRPGAMPASHAQQNLTQDSKEPMNAASLTHTKG